MRLLVTGGAGYIGSHTCKALAASGHLPITYDNLVYGHPWAVRWGPLEIGDLADRQRLDQVIQHYRPEGVIHFAAYAYVGESVKDPGKYYRNNVAGSLSLLEAMRDHGIPYLVFSSTCATYGVPERIPIPESHPQRPINPYGQSKLMVEQILQDFQVAHGIRSISLRYFNAAGADPDGEIGEAHDPETHLIPLVLEVAGGQRPHITVFGEDYDTPDGTCIRDYIHVTDLAQAHVLAVEALASGRPVPASLQPGQWPRLFRQRGHCHRSSRDRKADPGANGSTSTWGSPALGGRCRCHLSGSQLETSLHRPGRDHSNCLALAPEAALFRQI